MNTNNKELKTEEMKTNDKQIDDEIMDQIAGGHVQVGHDEINGVPKEKARSILKSIYDIQGAEAAALFAYNAIVKCTHWLPYMKSYGPDIAVDRVYWMYQHGIQYIWNIDGE